MIYKIEHTLHTHTHTYINCVSWAWAQTILHRDLANKELRRKQDIQEEENCPNQRCRQKQPSKIIEVHKP